MTYDLVKFFKNQREKIFCTKNTSKIKVQNIELYNKADLPKYWAYCFMIEKNGFQLNLT